MHPQDQDYPRDQDTSWSWTIRWDHNIVSKLPKSSCCYVQCAITHFRALNNLKTLQSPVFLSTGGDGRVQRGCGGIPLDRPLLLVSNHQTYALDIGPLIEGLVRQTGLLPRGLTHPAVFQVCLHCPHRHPCIGQFQPIQAPSPCQIFCKPLCVPVGSGYDLILLAP